MQEMRYIFMLIFVLFFVAVSITACSDGELEIKTVSEATETSEVSQGSTECTTEVVEIIPISDEPDIGNATPNEAESDLLFSTTKEENEATVCVYICGAVVQEGVYELSASARKRDVLEMAGGYSESAAHGIVNLAEIVTDGEKIYIPTQQEVENGTYDKMMNSSGTMSPGQSGNDGQSGSGRNQGTNVQSARYGGVVNINTASKEELMSLPGVGESRALDIITYRDSHGGFSDIKDIKNVSGIGNATYEKLKERITVQ